MFITFVDENLYKKKEKALRKYFMKCYKDLIFHVIPKLREPGKKDGHYTYDLITEDLFEKVYGKIQLVFTVKNDVAIIEDILPNDILIACHNKLLPIYKGIPYDTKKDLFKLKMFDGGENDKCTRRTNSNRRGRKKKTKRN